MANIHATLHQFAVYICCTQRCRLASKETTQHAPFAKTGLLMLRYCRRHRHCYKNCGRHIEIHTEHEVCISSSSTTVLVGIGVCREKILVRVFPPSPPPLHFHLSNLAVKLPATLVQRSRDLKGQRRDGQKKKIQQATQKIKKTK